MRRILWVVGWLLCVSAAFATSRQADPTAAHGWFALVDSLGNVQTRHSFEHGGHNSYIAAATRTCNGGYAFAGESDNCRNWTTITYGDANQAPVGMAHKTVHTTNGDSGLWFVTLDGNGNIQHERCFQPQGAGPYSHIASLLQLPDGRIVIAGHAGLKQHTTWLQWLSDSGEPLKTSIFKFESRDFRCAAMIQCPDGGFLLAGWRYSRDHPDYPAGMGRAWALKTDSSGRELWRHDYGTGYWTAFTDLAPTPDGGCFVVGEALHDNANSPRAGWIVRLNAQGDVVHEQRIEDRGTVDLRSIRSTPTGNFVFTGVAHDDAAARIFFGAISGDGNVRWSRILPLSDASIYYRGLAVVPDGGFVLVGSSRPSGSGTRVGLAVRTDAAGNVLWSRTYGCAGQNQVTAVAATPHGFLLAGSLEKPCPDTEFQTTAR